ncbi:MAG: HEAT repeat domain-containing protein [Anaerolineae bacterium]|nr:HEAT repeat domain-containing protein [Anaerolineae bacterium]
MGPQRVGESACDALLPSLSGPMRRDPEVCPSCGALLEGDDLAYLDKLILALTHPEPLTQRRAAYVLGLLGDERAVVPLARLLDTPADPYVLAEAANALGAIGGASACALLEELARDENRSVIVRRAARRALDGCDPGGLRPSL